MMLDKLKELIKQKKSEKETVNKISVKQILQEKNKPALIKESDNIYETTINNVHNIISPQSYLGTSLKYIPAIFGLQSYGQYNAAKTPDA